MRGILRKILSDLSFHFARLQCALERIDVRVQFTSLHWASHRGELKDGRVLGRATCIIPAHADISGCKYVCSGNSKDVKATQARMKMKIGRGYKQNAVRTTF